MIRTQFIFYIFTAYSFGQHIKFQNSTTNQGLSNNSILAIESDKDGGSWIAAEAFSQSVLFYILFSGFIVLICMVIVYLKNKITLSQQKYLEELVKVRTDVIEKQKKTLKKLMLNLIRKTEK
ncbi:hypothetical protein [Flavobacterium gyeonganense]|uniref:hypothetical protein n=1 Tax=Flavobacterium gyeonganense TaxID=1310418 RepID=UPI002413CE19|nr:hypothetical protein [Flavobacterium gyeonganense]